MIACIKGGQLMSRQPKAYFLCGVGVCFKITQSAEVQGSFKAVPLAKSKLK